jgi:hypothetical protein
MPQPPLLVPVIMIVAGLAIFALLLRRANERKNGGRRQLDELAGLLDDVRARVDDGEQFSATAAARLRTALHSLLHTLPKNAQRVKRS